MQKLLILITSLFFWFVGQSQTDGFKNIKLGERFEPKDFSKLYKVEQIAESGFRLTSLNEQKFCDIPIAYIDVKLNSDLSINLIQLNTVDNIYNSADEFLDAYVKVTECIVSTVGKPVYYDAGTDRKDGQITTAWNFNSQTCWLSLFGNSLSIYERSVRRHFLIAWAQGKGKTKMW